MFKRRIECIEKRVLNIEEQAKRRWGMTMSEKLLIDSYLRKKASLEYVEALEERINKLEKKDGESKCLKIFYV